MDMKNRFLINNLQDQINNLKKITESLDKSISNLVTDKDVLSDRILRNEAEIILIENKVKKSTACRVKLFFASGRASVYEVNRSYAPKYINSAMIASVEQDRPVNKFVIGGIIL